MNSEVKKKIESYLEVDLLEPHWEMLDHQIIRFTDDDGIII